MSKQQELMKNIADNVVGMMKEHGADWAKPWRKAVGATGEPLSAKKRHYTGINRMNLGLVIALQGYSSPVFGTFKQWKSLGAKVKKGSSGIPVVFYSQIKIKDKQSDEDRMVPMLKAFYVFNADQVEGWDGSWIKDQAPEDQEWEDAVDADALIEACGATFHHTQGNRAYYNRGSDSVTVPLRSQFKDASGYYGTAFHELVHWTGHKSRLDREFGNRFGDAKYAMEELVAELGAVMLSIISKVDVDPAPDHAKYLNSWIRMLGDHPNAIIKATSAAQKASEYILQSSNAQVAQAA